MRLTKAKKAMLMEKHRLFNKEMKRKGNHPLMLSFQEYLDNHFSKRKKRNVFKEIQTSMKIDDRVSHIPSLELNSKVNLSKKKDLYYTGTLVTGICTMHKSNAVPVINSQQATEISKMRRN